jgi:hypothetical protein
MLEQRDKAKLLELLDELLPTAATMGCRTRSARPSTTSVIRAAYDKSTERTFPHLRGKMRLIQAGTSVPAE